MAILACFVTVAFVVISLFPVSRALTTDSLTVHLTSGNFRGLSIPNGTERWLGIHFAKPPVGPLRFKAPAPISDPSRELITAASFGNACPQIPSPNLGAPVDEDCLFLNVRDQLYHIVCPPHLVRHRFGDHLAQVQMRDYQS